MTDTTLRELAAILKFPILGSPDEELKKDLFEIVLSQMMQAERYLWLRCADLDQVSACGIFVCKGPDNIIVNGADLDQIVDGELRFVRSFAEELFDVESPADDARRAQEDGR